jgi:hypothetical protein
MNHPTLPLALAALLLLAAAASPAEPPARAEKKPEKAAPAQARDEPLPTTDDVKKLVEGGDAAEAVKHLNRLLSLRGKAAEPYDKYELLTLKADAHLRLRAGAAAATALRQAGEATDDPAKKALCRATEELIRRSRNLAYAPRRPDKDAPKPEPIDLVNPESRGQALARVFTDEMAERLPQIEAAKANKAGAGVGPLIKAMAALREVGYLELAVNGSTDQINGMVDEMKTAGKDILTKAVERAGKKVDRIAQLANDTEPVRQVFPNRRGGYRAQTIQRRRGIKDEDIPELKKIADGCDEIVAQAEALQEAAGAVGEEFEEVIDAAEDLRVHVQRMLRVHGTEYTKGQAARRRGEDD